MPPTTEATSAMPATNTSWISEISAKPDSRLTTCDSRFRFAGKTRRGLIGDGVERGLIEREFRRKPGIFRKRQHLTEVGPLGNPARNEIGRFQRKLRRAPACGQSREFVP